ncbi:MAG: DUF4175 family protein, partial [Rhodospirillales bacterium]
MNALPPRATGHTENSPRLFLGLARGVLGFERLWRLLWPATSLVFVLLGLAFLDLLPKLPGLVHGTLLVGWTVGFLAAIRYAAKAWKAPSETQARHRVESDSGLCHRPLAALEDEPATPLATGLEKALWDLHKQRAAAASRNLRLGWPDPKTYSADPWALRVLAALFLAIGLAAGWQDPEARLLRAVNPFGPAEPAPPFLADIWVTPPDYTGRPPLTFKIGGEPTEAPEGATEGRAQGIFLVPEGSILLAQASGTPDNPYVRAGEVEAQFERLGEDADGYRLEKVLEPGEGLSLLADGEVKAAWPLRVTPDLPPSIEFLKTPQRRQR